MDDDEKDDEDDEDDETTHPDECEISVQVLEDGRRQQAGEQANLNGGDKHQGKLYMWDEWTDEEEGGQKWEEKRRMNLLWKGSWCKLDSLRPFFKIK